MRRCRLVLRSLVFLAVLVACVDRSSVAAQTLPADTTAAVSADPAADAAPYTTGLPERTPPPATLRAYWHLFLAFAAAWLLLFGYALSIGRRFRALEEEVRRLRAGAE